MDKVYYCIPQELLISVLAYMQQQPMVDVEDQVNKLRKLDKIDISKPDDDKGNKKKGAK